MARERRIPRRILLRARRRLGVELVHDGHQARWFYQLPTGPDPEPQRQAPFSVDELYLEGLQRLADIELQEMRRMDFAIARR